MRVKNLQAWAGDTFSHVAGDVIELPEATALARIEAGLAEAVPAEQAELALGVEQPTKAKAKKPKA